MSNRDFKTIAVFYGILAAIGIAVSLFCMCIPANAQVKKVEPKLTFISGDTTFSVYKYSEYAEVARTLPKNVNTDTLRDGNYIIIKQYSKK